ncbi:MAG TPA: hypothetical protein VG125_10675 [Pirellulales bacterium]|nr:hypothetical protein [Pirellulales bacterium]
MTPAVGNTASGTRQRPGKSLITGGVWRRRGVRLHYREAHASRSPNMIGTVA